MAFLSFIKSTVRTAGKAAASSAVKTGQQSILNQFGIKSTTTALPQSIAAKATTAATKKKTTVKKTTVKAGIPAWAWLVGAGAVAFAFLK